MVAVLYLILQLALVGCQGGTRAGDIVIDPSLKTTPIPCEKDSISSQPCLVEKSGTAITDSIGADITQWANAQSVTTLSVDIPNGYYSSKKIIFDDSNLISSNIRSGVTIFGVTGDATETLADCKTNGLQSTICSAAVNSFWTTVLGANVQGLNGSLSATLPEGYYDGTKTATMGDTNLLAANIKWGTTIFGVTGSLTSVYPTCFEDSSVINSTACSTGSANRYVSSVLGNNITVGTNPGGTTTVSATIPDGYYKTKSVSFTDANLVSAKIVAGSSIFGVAGSAAATFSACTDEAFNAGQCSTAASRYVTSAGGSDVTFWLNAFGGTTVTAALANGFYKNNSCLLTDGNLLATNIRSGTSIFGVTGSLDSTYSTCQEDSGTINGAKCTTSAANRYVSSFLGNNITGWSNPSEAITISATIPNGYYNTKSVSFTDANLVASNIKSGLTVFGVTGNLAGTYSACTDNDYNAGQCSTSAARYVTATLGSAISTWTNPSGSTTVSGTIAGGFYPFSPLAISFYDANLLASNIISGKSIFNVAGAANILMSNVYRDMNTTEITQQAETTTYAGLTLPIGYRDIPDIDKDDDGYLSAGVTSPQVVLAVRPGVTCGTNLNTIAARIAECASLNPTTASWDGTVKGNAGQGIWKLVTRAAPSKEVWQDTRTGLLWSSVVSTSDNWCRAAGNGQTTGNGYSTNDTAGICNNASYQPNYVSNSVTFAVQSWCAESGHAGLTLVPASGSGENWSTPSYVTAKGGMGLTPSGTSPSVRWRLPTRYDYEQADINGIRFVMPEMAYAGSGYEWSASVIANNRANAWYFNGAFGGLSGSNRTSSYSVRCVGR